MSRDETRIQNITKIYRAILQWLDRTNPRICTDEIHTSHGDKIHLISRSFAESRVQVQHKVRAKILALLEKRMSEIKPAIEPASIETTSYPSDTKVEGRKGRSRSELPGQLSFF